MPGLDEKGLGQMVTRKTGTKIAPILLGNFSKRSAKLR
jgi:hypothetical protein